MEKVIPKLRFPEFEGNWDNFKLKEISEKIKDGTHFSPKTYKKGDFKYLTSKNVKNGYLDFSVLEYVIKEDHDKIYSSSDVKYGDILLTKDGTIGQCCINTLDEEFSLLSSVAFIRPKNNFFNYFIYQLIISDKGQREIEKAIAGQALKRITLTKINDFNFNIPSLPEQQKIASFLTSVDERLTLLAHQKEKLEQYKKGVMQQIFSQKLRFKPENGNSYPDWEVKKFDDLFTSISTKPFQIKNTEILNEGIYPVIDQGMNKIAGFSNEKKKLFNKENEVIIYGDHTTFVKFIDFNFVIGADGTKILESKSDNIKYLYFALIHFNIKPEGYKRHFSIIKSIELPIPSLEEQQKIASFLSAIDVQIEGVSNKIAQTKTFKKGLLQQMFV